MTKPSIYIVKPNIQRGINSTSDYLDDGPNPLVAVASPTLPTLSALFSPRFNVFLCDNRFDSIDFQFSGKFVAITGTQTQLNEVRLISTAFREKGKTILIGGPITSSNPEDVRHYCDILVKGEAEDLIDVLMDDLISENWEKEYISKYNFPLKDSPTPDWTNYNNSRVLMGAIETSRGCVYSCEFCCISDLRGNTVRHKPIEKILGELSLMYSVGYRFVFIVDDNFANNPARTKEVLRAISLWNDKNNERMVFETAVTLAISKDDEFLDLLNKANFALVFIGVETNNIESLKEIKKYHNIAINSEQMALNFYRHGLLVRAGIITGFDNDTADTFDYLYCFIQESAIPFLNITVLNAYPNTPLYRRLAKENRILEGPYLPITNIIPRNMSVATLINKTHDLIKAVYAPDNFFARLDSCLSLLGGTGNAKISLPRCVLNDVAANSVYQETFAILWRFIIEDELIMKHYLEIQNKHQDKIKMLGHNFYYIMLQYLSFYQSAMALKYFAEE